MDPIENNRKPISRIKSPSVLSGDIGKLPPQAVDLEEAVLGALMLEKEAVRIISLLPKIKPAEIEGRKVRVPFSTSITFKLN